MDGLEEHLPALARIERAEQYFDFFGVAYEPRVLAVYRLRLLKRFGMELAEADAAHPGADRGEQLLLYAAALRRVHDEFARRLADPGGGGYAPAAGCAPAACSMCRT
ncbi:MAG TPA: nitrogenase-stabilizing/protective protein NifW [Anaeromyxobacteraceae bacterium]|nr:nitrogenase-stabilizing/protective protein NifW [Anaeromyxobacteraceae bacterium]